MNDILGKGQFRVFIIIVESIRNLTCYNCWHYAINYNPNLSFCHPFTTLRLPKIIDYNSAICHYSFMNNFNTVLFDFDGTLFNTSPGVFDSFDEVVRHYGLSIDRNVYNKMIGPPLKFSFVHYLGLPESEIPAAIDVYREYYTKSEGMFNCTVYPGIIELIKKLRQNGKTVCVATSKPEDFAKAILKRNNMLELFDFTGGSDMEEKYRVEKVDVIKYVLKNMNLENKKQQVLMIGDRLYDVNGAHSAGLKCMGILWGFGSRKEFEECGADYICETTDDVFNFLCK